MEEPTKQKTFDHTITFKPSAENKEADRQLENLLEGGKKIFIMNTPQGHEAFDVCGNPVEIKKRPIT